MRYLILFCFLLKGLLSFEQKTSVLSSYEFDSTYSIVALSSSFNDINNDSKKFCFYVNKLSDLNEMKQDWIIKNVRPTISLEQYSISIFVLRNKNIVSSELLIYPEQGIIHYGNSWYDFDFKKFKNVQTKNPLNYHSQSFSFINYLDYSFFKDSIQNNPNFLFLFEPTAKKFEGYFNLISSRSSDPDSPLFVLHDINEELKAEFPSEKFEVENVVNDKFNIGNKEEVKTKIKCSKALYDKYENKSRKKEDWIPSTFDTKVIFKE